MPTRQDEPTLRQRAEEKMRASFPTNLESLTPDQMQQLLHELQVHQIELEMQNEELRRTQDVLETTRARYFDLYDLAPVGYLTLSEQGFITEANLTAAEMLGANRSELVKQPFNRLIAPEDEDAFYFQRRRMFQLGTPQTGELHMRKKDGTPFWAHLRTSVTKNDAGMPMCRVTLSDITAQKQAQAALQQSEERFRMLVERVSQIAVQGYASDGTVILWNKASEEISVILPPRRWAKIC